MSLSDARDAPRAAPVAPGGPGASPWRSDGRRSGRHGVRDRGRHWWLVFLGGTSLLVLLWPLLPAGPERVLLIHLTFALSALASVTGVVLHQPPHAHAWWFYSGALAAASARSILLWLIPEDSVVALWVEYGGLVVFSLLGLAFLVAVVRIWATRRRNRAGFVDGALVASGALTTLLALSLDPQRPGFGPANVAMVLMALLIAVVAVSLVRFVLARPSLAVGWLLLAAVASASCASVFFAIWPVSEWGSLDVALPGLLLLVTMALLGAAALHPSMTQLTGEGPLRQRHDSTRARFVILLIALLPPSVTTVLRAEDDLNTRLAGLAGLVLTLLVCFQIYWFVQARDEDRAKLHRLVAQQHVLLGLSHAALGASRLDEVLNAAVRVVSRTLGPAWCALLVHTPAPGGLQARAQRDGGRPPGADSQPPPLTLPPEVASAITRPHRAPQPAVLDDAALAAVPGGSAGPLVSGVAVPVATAQDGTALLTVLFRERRTLTDDEERFLLAVAGLLSRAIDRRHEEEQAWHRSLHDPLTGLANRRLLLDRLSTALESARASDRLVALVFIDLNHFKAVNDTWGHATGDELLRHVAACLVSAARPADTVARLAGDEFVLVLDGIPDPTAAEAVAARILDTLRTPVRAHGVDLVASASVGIALSTDVADSSDPVHDLLTTADAAMYRDKLAERRGPGLRAGRGMVTFDPLGDSLGEHSLPDPRFSSRRERLAASEGARSA